jgi:hypothetical protein
MMVVGAAILGGDRPGRWWGVMRGGASAVSVAEGGGAGRRRTHARDVAVAASAIQPEE